MLSHRVSRGKAMSGFDRVVGSIGALIIGSVLLTEIVPPIFEFFKATWVAWLLLLASGFAINLCRKRRGLLYQAALKVLWPVTVGLVLLVLSEIAFGLFSTFSDPDVVRSVEGFLLDQRDHIKSFDKAISHWLWVLPAGLIVVYLLPDYPLLKYYVKVKSTTSWMGILLLTMTSFTFLSSHPMRVLAQGEYADRVSRYELSLRNEQRYVSQTVAARAMIHAVHHFDSQTTATYKTYISTVKISIPDEPVSYRIDLFGTPAEQSLMRTLSKQADKDVDKVVPEASTEDLRTFLGLDEFAPAYPPDRALPRIIEYSPDESKVFEVVPASADIRAQQAGLLARQVEREGRLKKLCGDWKEMAASAFSEAIGAKLFNGESIAREYVKEVIKKLSDRAFRRIVDAWYSHGERLTHRYFVDAIEHTVPLQLEISVLTIRPADVPLDPKELKSYTETVRSEMQGEAEHAKVQIDEWHKQFEELEKEKEEDRFE